MIRIPYDCWGIVFSYVSNQYSPQGPSDLSQCVLTCKLFHEIACQSRPRLLSVTSDQQHRIVSSHLLKQIVKSSNEEWAAKGNLLDGTVLIRNKKTQELYTLQTTSMTLQLAISPHQPLLATVHPSDIKIWNIVETRLLWTLKFPSLETGYKVLFASDTDIALTTSHIPASTLLWQPPSSLKRPRSPY